MTSTRSRPRRDVRIGWTRMACMPASRACPTQIEDAWAAARALALPRSYRGARAHRRAGDGRLGDRRRPAAALRGRSRRDARRSTSCAATRCRRTSTTARSSSPRRTAATPKRRSPHSAQAIASGAKCVAITTGGKLLRAGARSTACRRSRSSGTASRGRRSAGASRRCSRSAAGSDCCPIVESDLRAGAGAHARRLPRRSRRDVPEASNPAKEIARRFAGRLPVIIGSEAMTPVAYRWRTQINENAQELGGRRRAVGDEPQRAARLRRCRRSSCRCCTSCCSATRRCTRATRCASMRLCEQMRDSRHRCGGARRARARACSRRCSGRSSSATSSSYYLGC